MTHRRLTHCRPKMVANSFSSLHSSSHLVGIVYRPREHANTDQTYGRWSGNGIFTTLNLHNFVKSAVLMMSFSLRQSFAYHFVKRKKKNILYNPFVTADFVIVEIHCRLLEISKIKQDPLKPKYLLDFFTLCAFPSSWSTKDKNNVVLVLRISHCWCYWNLPWHTASNVACKECSFVMQECQSRFNVSR